MKGRSKTRVLGPELMPLKQAVEIFKFGLRTFRTWAAAGQLQLQNIGGAAYVVLSTLEVKLGAGTYAHLMRAYRYDPDLGWIKDNSCF